jgi:hypothetical protein
MYFRYRCKNQLCRKDGIQIPEYSARIDKKSSDLKKLPQNTLIEAYTFRRNRLYSALYPANEEQSYLKVFVQSRGRVYAKNLDWRKMQ